MCQLIELFVSLLSNGELIASKLWRILRSELNELGVNALGLDWEVEYPLSRSWTLGIEPELPRRGMKEGTVYEAEAGVSKTQFLGVRASCAAIAGELSNEAIEPFCTTFSLLWILA